MWVAWIALDVVGGLALIGLGLGLIGYALEQRAARKPSRQVSPFQDLLETKQGIRRDEVTRWHEAWQRAAGQAHVWEARQEISRLQQETLRKRRAEEAAARDAEWDRNRAARDAELAARLTAARRNTQGGKIR